MKLSTKVLTALLVFTVVVAVLINFILIPNLKQKHIEDIQREYSTSLETNIIYMNEHIDDISNDINYISTIEDLFIFSDNYYTSYTKAEDDDFVYNPNENEKQIQEFITEYKAENKDIDDIFFGLQDGSFITDDPVGLIGDTQGIIYNYDPRVRPWYKKAIESPEETIVSPLYQRIRLLEGTSIADPINYYLTVARAIIDDDGNVRGAIGVNISLELMLSEIRISYFEEVKSLGIMFNENIACILKDGELFVDPQFSMSELRRILVSLEGDENSLCDLNGEEECIIKIDSAVTDSSLFYVVDGIIINERIQDYIRSIIATLAVSILVFTIMILLLINFYIVHPINKLKKVTTSITETMDFSQKVKYRSKDEVGELAINFNFMMEEIRAYRDNLDSIVKERTEELTKFSSAIEQSPVAVVIMNRVGRIEYVNPKYTEMAGYSLDDLEGKRMPVLGHQKHNKEFFRNIIEMATIGNDWKGVLESEKKNGEIFYENLMISSLRDENGKISNIIAIIEDLTEFIKIERDLTALFENMPTGFAEHEIIYDENGKAIDYKYIKINESFKKHTGLTEEILGKSVRELLPGTEDKWIETYEEVVKSRKSKTFEDYAGVMDKYFRVTAFPTGKKTFATIFDDVTENKKAEMMLEDNEKRLRYIFETTPFAVVRTVKGIIYYANQNFVKMTGLNLKDSVMDTYYDLKDRRDIVRKLRNGEGVTNQEIRFKKANGEPFYALVSVIKMEVKGEDGLLAWLMDISDIKETQRQLTIAKEQAEAATHAKSDFLANMSHEIRTPMNAVIGLNKLMKTTEMTTKQADYVDKIDRSASKLLNIINDILDFSKIESGKMEVENIKFDIDEVVKDQISINSMNAYDKGIELVYEKDLKIPKKVKGDPHKLGQVLGNLINNAVKFTENGHVLIKTKLESQSPENTYIKFSVSDTGIGMDKNKMAQLFLPFTQADTSTTRKYGGTGLGLVITKELVEMMGGSISVKSRNQRGTEFAFKIPFITASNKRKIKKVKESKKVLVIENDKLTRKVLCKYIGKYGYHCTPHASAKIFPETPEDGCFDVVIINDLQKEEGTELYEKIKECRAKKKKPKIILMQSGTFGDEENIKPGDEDAVLMKPIFPDTLSKTLSNVIDDIEAAKKARKKIKNEISQIENVSDSNILVVEDNEINRLVICDILKKAGFMVDEAVDGKQAVEKINANKYDLVLMDIQMPTLDGYEATKIVRRKYSMEELPIIALTADVVLETKHKTADIGMNDFLSKPIDIKVLYEKLIKWLGIKDLAHTKEMEADNELVLGTMKEILNGFNVEKAFSRTNHNVRFYINTLNKFEAESKALSKEIVALNKANDAEKLAFIAHSQKSVSAYLGAEELSKMYAELEDDLKEKGINKKTKSQILEIEKTINIINDEIDELNRKFDEMDIFSDDVEQAYTNRRIINEIKELIEKLDKNDKKASDIAYKLKGEIKNKNILGMLDLAIGYIADKKYDKAKSIANDILELVESTGI